VPDKPSAPTTQTSGSNTAITWTAPSFDGGSQIVSYVITIMASDGISFIEDASVCDGTQALTILSLQCIIPSSHLATSSLFTIPWGDEVYAKVAATNIRGMSEFSDAGNGAVITRSPDPPINLQNDLTVTTSVQIGITWEDGIENGGTPVLDYRIYFDQGSDNWILHASNVVDQRHQVTGLSIGNFYKFKVEARNAFGFSSESDVLTILTYSRPDPPAPSTTAVNGYSIDVTWTEPYNNGYEVLYYKIYFRGNDETSFHLELVYCDGMEQVIFDTRQCNVPLAVLQAAPYNLEWGSNIVVHAIAVNQLGDSDPAVGTGAQILMLPSPPEFSQVLPPSSLTKIELTWPYPFDGGSPVLAYILEIYDSYTDQWYLVSDTIFTESYTYPNTIMSLTYTFRMFTRTAIGDSVYTDQ
jgi:hypothetical protein